MASAKFITFEGGEGAGKSTQIGLLAAALSAAGIPVQTTREPGGSPGAEQIRELLVTGAGDRWDAMTEALLHFAARREHLRSVVWPNLAAGQWVLSDRFADSTMAYQGYGHGLGREPIEQLYALVVGKFRARLDVDPRRTGGTRIGAGAGAPRRRGPIRGPGRRSSTSACARDFREIAEREPHRCVLIDGSGEA